MAATILAVDDSASMRQMVSFTLKHAGYEVIQAADGVEALEYARNNSVNLVLTDVNMLKQAYLEAPQITRVANELSRRFPFPKNILTVKEFYREYKKALDARRET